MSRPEDKIPPIDQLFIRQDVTRVSLGEPRPYIGWREVVRQYLPEHLKSLIPSSAETDEYKLKESLRSRIPLDKNLPYREAEKARDQEIENLIARGDTDLLIPVEKSLFEKVIPTEIREFFRPSTITRESLAAKGLKVARTVSGIDEPFSMIDPTPLFRAGGAAVRVGKVGAEVVESKKILSAMDNIISEARTGEGLVGAGFDPSLFKKLGANLYKGDLPAVAIKETLQNAVDSVRGIEGGGKIKLDFSSFDRKFRIADNGHGMSPDVIAKEFMDVGGSLKNAEASGGYGLAKVGIFSQAEEIRVISTAEVQGKKVETTLIGSGEDWINGKMRIEAHPIEKKAPTGTIMEIVLTPEAGAIDKWHSAEGFVRDFQESNKLKNIDVEFTRDGKSFKMGTYTFVDAPVETLHLEKADIDIYPSTSLSITGYTQPRVLNNGLFQFESYMQKLGKDAPLSVIFDVKPKVGVDDPGYPFTTSREELKGSTQEAVNNYLKDIGTLSARTQFNLLLDNITKPTNIKSSSYGMSVYNIDKANTPEILEIASGAKYSGTLSDVASDVSASLYNDISTIRRYKNIKSFDFGGFGLSPLNLGVNIDRNGLINSGISIKANVGGISEGNLILINPYTILDEVIDELGRLSPRRAAQQTWEVLIHEVVHQLARGHDEDFAAAFTRVIHAVAPSSEINIKKLNYAWEYAIQNGIGEDFKLIKAKWSINNAENIFRGFTGHLR